ncbi:MAG: 50S ribosomal protein L9 [bacterium]|nr:50S ribosomal protein L9 [Mycoplasmatota bacterium]MDD6757519.1 50S ribosomal protein L9 [bacterium]MDY2908895.1 50S ribosomal protein L9 [Candidatus Faecimonas sp.]
MEVIFIKDLKNQGKKGQIKKVKDGYAENFLIKNGYAVIKNKENMTKLEKEQQAKAANDAKNKKEAEELKKELDKLVLDFQVKTGEGDKVFGSVSIKQIKEALSKAGYKIEKSQIELTTAMASLGFHRVDINLYPGVKATIKAHIIK